MKYWVSAILTLTFSPVKKVITAVVKEDQVITVVKEEIMATEEIAVVKEEVVENTVAAAADNTLAMPARND